MHKFEIYGLSALALLLVAMGLSAYIEERTAGARKDAIVEQKDHDIQDIRKQMAADRDEARQRISELEKQKQAIKTPEQALRVIHESPDTPLQHAEVQKLPDAPSLLSQQDAIDVAKFSLNCRKCEIDRQQKTAELADKDKVIADQNDKIDAYKRAEKGGNFWQRVKRNSKWFLVGALAGGTAVAATRR